MNIDEFKNYIDKLCTLSNNYYIYDEIYIKKKYNINSYDFFRKYYKKNHNHKLIFNSLKSENLFIKLMNIDSEYVTNKYGNSQAQNIVDFFVKRTDCYFSLCEEYYDLNKNKLTNDLQSKIKNHIVNCKCKIKVKSIVNLVSVSHDGQLTVTS